MRWAAALLAAVAVAASAQPGAGLNIPATASQGALLTGAAPAGATALTLDGQAVLVAHDGRFVVGFDRDAVPGPHLLAATLADGERVSATVQVTPRAWSISRLSTLPKYPSPRPSSPPSARRSWRGSSPRARP